MSIRDSERLREKLEVVVDGRQIFFLFFGGAVVVSMVFVLGVMVGKRLGGAPNERATAAGDALAALDDLDAASDDLSRAEALAFPDQLGAGRRRKAGPLGAADVAPSRIPAVVAPVVAPAALAPAALAPVVTPAALAPAALAPAVARPAVAPGAAVPGVVAPASAAKGTGLRFTLQLSAFQSRAEAEAFASSVRAAGFTPFIAEREVPGKGKFFRVRVGDHASHAEAMAAKTAFEEKLHVIAYIGKL